MSFGDLRPWSDRAQLRDNSLMSRPTNDDKLRQRVRDALARDVLVDELQLDVEVEDGVVLLVGTVGSYAERLVIQHTTRNVDGVHNLIDAVDVKPSGSMHPSDAELKRIVEQVLAWNALVPEHRVDVSVIDGLVALTGSCPSKPKRRRPNGPSATCQGYGESLTAST